MDIIEGVSQMLYQVAVDCGRSFNKGYSGQEPIEFPSVVGEYRDLALERRNPEDMVVEYRGERFFVGELARAESHSGKQMYLQSKVHFDTKLLTLVMLHRLIPSGQVFLCTGQPITNQRPAEKERYQKLLEGRHTISVNREAKTFDIVRVQVSPECAAAAWHLHAEGTVCVLDVGSTTTNFATAKNGTWIDRQSGTLDFGIETLPVERSMFVRTVVAELSKRLRNIPPLVTMGGAAKEVAKYLADYGIPVSVHKEPKYANVLAYYDLGAMALARSKEKQ